MCLVLTQAVGPWKNIQDALSRPQCGPAPIFVNMVVSNDDLTLGPKDYKLHQMLSSPHSSGEKKRTRICKTLQLCSRNRNNKRENKKIYDVTILSVPNWHRSMCDQSTTYTRLPLYLQAPWSITSSPAELKSKYVPISGPPSSVKRQIHKNKLGVLLSACQIRQVMSSLLPRISCRHIHLVNSIASGEPWCRGQGKSAILLRPQALQSPSSVKPLQRSAD